MTERVKLGKYLLTALTVGDFIILNISYLLTLFVLGANTPFASSSMWVLVNVSFIPSVVFFADIHNRRILYADKMVLSAFKSAVVECGVLAAILYTLNIFHVGMYHGLFFAATFFILLSIWWLVSRRVLKKLRRMGLNFKRVVIVGAGQTGALLYRELQGDAGYGYRTMGFFDDDKSNLRDCHDTFVAGLDQLADFVNANHIDIIYYTLDAEDDKLILKVMRIAEEIGASFVYVPKFSKVLNGQFLPSSMGNIPILKHSISPLHRRWNKVIKRTLDLFVSITFLIVSPIIFIPVAIIIKLTSPGPVIFKQKRTGIYGRDFVCYKFRTMRVNADSDRLQATENDPRKTKFGDFLRRSSIDELPQFFNVLLGNMSVVGPRPHMVSQTEEYSALIDKYMVRHAVKPGITGWAQINGYRGGTKHLWQMEKRVEYDVWYIRNWNIFLDIKIIFLTAFNALRKDKNAY